ncbi:hypothetical protein [Dactylosporangium sp. NPDC000521]|uniref:hypothetical protein n=1 Tax=Dactylosporangium sp. NPDC000521 TaxID=3363975 RepID=UPI00368C7EFF
MAVVEGLELAERVQEVALVPDQGAVQESLRQLSIQRSMMEFIRGIRMPVVMTVSPVSVIRASKAAVNFESRSRIKNLALLPTSSRSITTLRPS